MLAIDDCQPPLLWRRHGPFVEGVSSFDALMRKLLTVPKTYLPSGSRQIAPRRIRASGTEAESAPKSAALDSAPTCNRIIDSRSGRCLLQSGLCTSGDGRRCPTSRARRDPRRAGKTSRAASPWRQPSRSGKNAAQRVFRGGLIESHPAAQIIRMQLVDRSDVRISRTAALRQRSSAAAFFRRGTATPGYPPIAARCAPDSCSMSLCSEFPCASIVTIAGKSSTVRCHIASGVPNSRSETPSTCLIERA